ncbi:MAG: hypothetical protein JW969_04565 [Spirochaetales bacterium]|nr:hypothetical protein [Spirochaetales bacterium]
MKKIVLSMIFITLCALSFAQSEKLRVGVVQFEEKNNIGIQNAGTIIAEWVVTEVKKIDLFEVEERLLLEKVLEEQELSLSNVFDETKAIKIGQLYSVDAIITGAVSKFGSKISVTGRIINATSGKILKTASVSTDDIDQVEHEVTLLTNELCDISREEFQIKEDIRKRELIQLVVGAGGSISPLGLEAVMRVNYRWLDLWVLGIPVGYGQNIEFGGFFNILTFVGVGAAFGMTFDNDYDYAGTNYILFGIQFKPRVDMEMMLLIGGALSGTIWTQYEVKVDGYWSFPSNFSISGTYYFNENFGVTVRYLNTQLGNLIAQVPYFTDTDEYIYRQLSISVLYRFPIAEF